MRTSKVSGMRRALFMSVLLLASAPATADEVKFENPLEALKQGISAYAGGYYELALPALEAAVHADEFMANYYMAKIYADNTGSRTDHARAYELFRKISDEHADIDPDDDPRAPYVGKSLTALAGYMLRGLPDIGLKPNPELAADLLYNASATFNDEDAQFELAKLQLKGEGVDKDVQSGKHWLATLSKKGHAGAQAFFADLLWRGLYMDPDPSRALALIAISVANASPQDRLWIEDIYQNIYCGAGEGIRKQATGLVAEWGNRYKANRKPELSDRLGLGRLSEHATRTCSNGEPVNTIDGSAVQGQFDSFASDNAAGQRPFARGSASPSLRDVGTQAPSEHAR